MLQLHNVAPSLVGVSDHPHSSTMYRITIHTACLLLMLAIGASITAGQTLRTDQPIPLERLLNPDGSLRGDLDISHQFRVNTGGWRLHNAADGSPQFVRADRTHKPSAESVASHPDDIFWDEKFGAGGPDEASIDAIATGGGKLYVAGDFSVINGVSTGNLACWDGTKWSMVGGGIEGTVNVMVVNGSDLYIAGYIYTAGDVNVNDIARWDGTTWHAVGPESELGVNGSISALAVDGDNVYVGGYFERAGSWLDTTATVLNHIGVWHKSTNTWHALESQGHRGVGGQVYALAVNNGVLYVGGGFDSIGTMPVRSIAAWNIASSSWSLLGDAPTDGVYGSVHTLAIREGTLYVGGNFESAGTVAANSLARWNPDSRTWDGFGSDTIIAPNGYVRNIITTGSGLYINGVLDGSEGDTTSYYQASWNNGTWERIPNEGGAAYDMTIDGQKIIIAGGQPFQAGTETIRVWDGTAWNNLARVSGGSYTNVNAIAAIGNDIYIAGSFYQAGGLSVNNIVRWNRITRTWHQLGNDTLNGINGTVMTMVASGSRLYLGGYFFPPGSKSVTGIVMWDSQSMQWNWMGDGVKGQVSAMTMHGDRIYVAGQFDTVGTIRAMAVAIWDESDQAWSSLGVETIAGVESVWADGIAVSDTAAYLAGYVNSWMGSGYGIIQWHLKPVAGDPYEIIGLGVDGQINTMMMHNGQLHVGGSFSEIGGVPLNNLARWDGTDWQTVGSGQNAVVSGAVYALVSRDGILYVGGSFDNAGTQSANNIALWDGAGWNALGSGTSGYVQALLVEPNDLYAGGNFAMAGGKTALHVARWSTEPSSVPQTYTSSSASLSVRPNPLAHAASIELTLQHAGHVTITIANSLGETVATVFDGDQTAGTYSMRWEPGDLSDGIYFCRIQTATTTETRAIQIVR
jgi:trimeric autotransporter adhesin